MTNPKKLYWREMMRFHNAQKLSRRHRTAISGRRIVKNAAKHVGKVIRSSRIIHDVPIERHFKVYE